MSLLLPSRTKSPQQSEAEPPLLSWPAWYERQERTWKQGMHVLCCGPTQSGKTTAARMMVRIRDFVVVFGTKPIDPSLDAYVEEGYARIDHWPPEPKDLRNQEEGQVRLILWPKIKARKEMRAYRSVYAKCLDSVFVDGGWTVVIDEALWFASKQGLDLADSMSEVAYGAASAKVTMVLLTQRPANIPPVTWTSVSQALLWHMGRVEDIRELASLSTYDPRPVMDAIHELHGHEFLDLPVRAQADWAISEVDLWQG